MKENFTKEKLESVLRKINWAQQILDSARDSSDDLQMIDILSGVSFIMYIISNASTIFCRVIIAID